MALYCNITIIAIPILSLWLYSKVTYSFAVDRDPSIRKRAKSLLLLTLISGSLWWVWLCLPLIIPEVINYGGYGYVWLGLFLTTIISGRKAGIIIGEVSLSKRE
jgi:hypothetical protein